MLNNRFFRVSSKGIVVYNEKYGSRASFNSYIEGFEKFQLEEDQREAEIVAEVENNPSKIDLNKNILQKNLENSNISNSEITEAPTKISSSNKVSRQALENLRELGKRNNLEKFLEAHGVDSTGISVPELKQAFDKFLSKQEEDKEQNEISKWVNQIEDLRALRNEKELKKWLESKGLPAANVSIPAVQKELQKYFQKDDKKTGIAPKIGQPNWGKRSGNKNSGDKSGNKIVAATSQEKLAAIKKMQEVSKLSESYANGITPKIRVPRDFGPCIKVEEFNGRSILLREDTLANKLWEDFKGMSAPKQIAVVVGITVVTAALGFLSWQVLLLAFPSVFQVNHYWTEVLAQWFIQRQESTFHLLQHTAQNAKPLSTAWANQYLLWKYI